MLSWAIDLGRSFGSVVVVTPDEEVALIAQRSGVSVLPLDATTQSFTVDQVVQWAANQLEATGTVVVLQATSPFTRPETVQKCLAHVEDGAVCAFTVADDRHLRLEGDLLGPIRSVTPRVSRQQMPPAWRDLGSCWAIQASEARRVGRGFSPGQRIELVPVSGWEAVDIDHLEDWWVAEAWATRRRILYRVDGGGHLGLGHVYRALALGDALTGHDLTLCMNPTAYPDGVALAKSRGAKVLTLSAGTDQEWTDTLAAVRPDLVIVEVGPTTEQSVRDLIMAGYFVVTVEDRGPGADVAHLTFNDLDAPALHGPQRYQGSRYAVLRDEFTTARWRDVGSVDRILVTFGGTDPQNYTQVVVDVLREAGLLGHATVLLGPGYVHTPPTNVEVVRGVQYVSRYMEQADLAFTSCGRTTYELAACGVPMIALVQNAHEARHIDMVTEVGGMVLTKPTPESLSAALEIAQSVEFRRSAKTIMAQVDLRHGASRFWEIVWQAYREWERTHQETIHDGARQNA